MSDAGGKSTVSRTRDDILHEHHTLEQAMERMVTASGLEELLLRLQELRTLAVPHFSREEAPDGFFDTVRSRAARHFDRVASLSRDHRAFLTDLDTLAEQARACLAGPVTDILRQAAVLASRLREHEASETALLTDAMYSDGGQGD